MIKIYEDENYCEHLNWWDTWKGTLEHFFVEFRVITWNLLLESEFPCLSTSDSSTKLPPTMSCSSFSCLILASESFLSMDLLLTENFMFLTIWRGVCSPSSSEEIITIPSSSEKTSSSSNRMYSLAGSPVTHGKLIIVSSMQILLIVDSGYFQNGSDSVVAVVKNTNLHGRIDAVFLNAYTKAYEIQPVCITSR